jgi:taurine--2-oxoglutarate transaminase
MTQFVAACNNRGLWLFTHVFPPRTVKPDEAGEGLAILDEAFDVADRYYVGAWPS